VLSATPHLTLTHYFRDFCLGILEEFCSKACCLCGAAVGLELRLRTVMDLPVYRARCTGPDEHSFTFLPLFVAPGKWYGYPVIEDALRVMIGEQVPHRAFVAWNIDRERRTMEGVSRIPCATTLRRWWDASRHDAAFWLDLAALHAPAAAVSGWPSILPTCGPDGIAGERTPSGLSSISFPSLPVQKLLLIIISLGEILMGPGLSGTSPLGVGLWFLETQARRRCLSRSNFLGRLIPCSFPSLAVTPRLLILHTPKTSPP